MNDAFSMYAEVASPVRAPGKRKKPPSALEIKMEEKQRLHKRYRLWRRDNNRAVLQAEPRLVGFMRYLKTVQPEHAGELIEAIADSWLVSSAREVRLFALRMIAARADKLNRQYGFEALDDAMPPEIGGPPEDVYFQARHILHKGGRG